MSEVIKHDGTAKVTVEPEHWVNVQFTGWMNRGGTLPGATVYMAIRDRDELLRRLAEVMGFAYAAGLEVTQGSVHLEAPPGMVAGVAPFRKPSEPLPWERTAGSRSELPPG
jgi:hypothetical protein